MGGNERRGKTDSQEEVVDRVVSIAVRTHGEKGCRKRSKGSEREEGQMREQGEAGEIDGRARKGRWG